MDARRLSARTSTESGLAPHSLKPLAGHLDDWLTTPPMIEVSVDLGSNCIFPLSKPAR